MTGAIQSDWQDLTKAYDMLCVETALPFPAAKHNNLLLFSMVNLIAP